MKTRNLIGKQFGHPRMTVLPYGIETTISRKRQYFEQSRLERRYNLDVYLLPRLTLLFPAEYNPLGYCYDRC